jgi:hypothetical protein
MLTFSSIVATDEARIAFDSAKAQGDIDFDLTTQAVSIEQSCQDILRVVSKDPDLSIALLTPVIG